MRGAYELLEQACLIDCDYTPLSANDLHIHQKWTISLCQEGRYAEALRLLEQAYERRPEAELFARGRFVVCTRWVEYLFAEGRLNDGWEVLEDRRRHYAGCADWLPYEAEAFCAAARQLAQRGELDQAHRLLQQGRLLQPSHAGLLQTQRDLTRDRL